MKPGLFIKTTRMNFLPASLLPFFTGAALAIQKGISISFLKLILGIIGVASAHLAGNVINELYDNKSGVDQSDDRRSPFFGGSKVIKDGLVSYKEVAQIAIFFLSAAFICGISILFITKDPVYILIMAVALILTAGYTAPPFKFSYRMLGEVDIFLLFGVFMVSGSFYLFSGAFSTDAVFLSLPVSFMIIAVILCNEIPDHLSDTSNGKKNLIALTGTRSGYKVYGAAVLFSFLFIIFNMLKGIVSPLAVIVVVFYPLGIKAFFILKKSPEDFKQLIKASAFTGGLHFLTGTAVMAATLLK